MKKDCEWTISKMTWIFADFTNKKTASFFEETVFLHIVGFLHFHLSIG